MPIDIHHFRQEKGGNVESVRELQNRRFKPQEKIDEIINLDVEWRKLQFQVDNLKGEKSKLSKEFGTKMKAKENCDSLKAQIDKVTSDIASTEARCKEVEAARTSKLNAIGNFVHDSVPVSKNEEDNLVVTTHGQCRPNNGKLFHHHELLHMIDGYGSEQGVTVAGHRGYFLKGCGVLLNQALINYGLAFLMKKQYTPLQPPFFMKKDVMAETAQLEEFDEALYKVTGANEDFYLIATSEQPISAYHRGEWLEEKDLPLKYAGYSSCFRKEAGSHGRDAWGIFRIHQFEKVEQFVLTAPDKSWEMQQEMIETAQDFYKSLGLSYRVVNIVSGELNNAAARKFDLEAWFPTLGVYRELVSCSNCTDYQARAMETRFGQKKMGQTEKQYVHMLNATLTATERTICCILENYQTEDGVLVPEVLQPYMAGMKIMPFVKPCPENVNQKKQQQAAAKKDKQEEAQPAPKEQPKKAEPKAEKKEQPKKEQPQKGSEEKEQPRKGSGKEQNAKVEQGSKKGGDTQKAGDKKGGDKKGGDKPAGGLDPKLVAKVAKEGGKKAQDIAGLRDMGGVSYFHVSVDICDSNWELMQACMDAFNKPCPEDAEERTGGADDIGKCLLSYNDQGLAIFIHVPKNLTECKIDEWYSALTAGYPVEKISGDSQFIKAYLKADPNNNVYPFKIRDEMINKGYQYLAAKQLVMPDDGADDDMVFGDDDFYV